MCALVDGIEVIVETETQGLCSELESQKTNFSDLKMLLWKAALRL